MFRKKMLIVYFVSIFFPMLIIGGLYCRSVTNSAKNRNLKEIGFDVDVAAEKIERVTDNARMICDELYCNTTLNKNLLMKNGSLQDFINNSNEIYDLNRYCIAYDFIESIEIYTFNENLYRNAVLLRVSDIPKNSKWYDKFLEIGSDYSVISYYDKDTGRSRLCIVRRLSNYGRCNDILKINISYESIENEIIYNEEKGRMYLFNNENKCIAVSPDDDLKTDFLGTDYSALKGKKTVEKELRFPVGYTLCCLYTENYTGDTMREMVGFIVSMLAALFVSALLVCFITYTMTEKMAELTAATKKMQNGEFVKISEDGIGTDEIGMLAKGFNGAVTKINTLINEIYLEKLKSAEIEREKNKAEFIALQRQINPHFLFNIMEILRMKCVKNKNTETADMIKNISVMLRRQISWKKDVITFDEELVFIRAFASLYECNLDNDVSIEFLIDEDTKRYVVPKMAVQVFVENAFRHGLDNLEKNRVFSLSAKAEGGRLIIKVSDNGKGMDTGIADAINNGDIECIREMSGNGIANVLSRMKLYFNDDFKVSVCSVPYEKTEITINLPAVLDIDRRG